jgi:hypothetical protein
VTDPERMEVVLDNPVILIHEKKITAMSAHRHRCRLRAPGVNGTLDSAASSAISRIF